MPKQINIADDAWNAFRNAVAARRRQPNATGEQKDTLALDNLRSYTSRVVAQVATSADTAAIADAAAEVIRAGTTVTDVPSDPE